MHNVSFPYPVHSPVCLEFLLIFLGFLGSSARRYQLNCVQSSGP